MEGIDHVHIIQVGSSCLVGNVDRMFQRQVPHRESLELGVSSTDATLVLIIELRETGGHLTAARTRGRHDDEWTRSFHILVFAETFIGGNQFHIVGIAVDRVVDIRLDTLALQTMTELIGSMLTRVVRNHNTAHHEVTSHKLIAQTQYILIIGDTEVCTNLVLLDIVCIDHNHNLNAVM